MIEKLMILNKQAKTILNKEYISGNILNHQESMRLNIFLLELIKNNINTNILYNLCILNSTSQSNIYYKYYNNLYIIIICDENENELAMIDFINFYISLIQELFYYNEVTIENNIDNIHILSNEVIVGGVVCELNKNEIIKGYMEIIKQ